MPIEEKLKEFRSRKQAENKPTNLSKSHDRAENKTATSQSRPSVRLINIWRLFGAATENNSPVQQRSDSGAEMLPVHNDADPAIASTSSSSPCVTGVPHQSTSVVSQEWTRIDVAILVTKIFLWCLLMTLFVVIQFGAVFFVLSVFYLIYQNFRKTPRKQGEPSAYSVFNPNCEAIDGTLKAEQFENELKFGALSVH